MNAANEWLTTSIGLYRTSCLVRKSGKLSKSRLSRNRTFSFPDAGLLTIKKNPPNFFFNFYNFFFSKFFFQFSFQIFFVYLFVKMFENTSPDSVRSGRTCSANLGVQSCRVRKLVCPVRLSPRSAMFCLYLIQLQPGLIGRKVDKTYRCALEALTQLASLRCYRQMIPTPK